MFVDSAQGGQATSAAWSLPSRALRAYTSARFRMWSRKSTMPILSWRDASGAPREAQFEEEVSISRDVGEAPQQGVIALADPRVSRVHARIEKTFRGFELSD